jgi:hypothetical protein
MSPQNQWPPLEQVREWAAQKIPNGQVAPSATGKYTRLIVLIDEILTTQTSTIASATAENRNDSASGEHQVTDPLNHAASDHSRSRQDRRRRHTAGASGACVDTPQH